MTKTYLEHVNLTVSDNRRSAELFKQLFGWHIRWEGPPARGGGHTIHVGSDTSYIALYTTSDDSGHPKGYAKAAPLNHVGMVVDNLLAVKAAVEAAGFEPFAHERYEPGERFYFFDWDGVEFEIISYA